MNDRMQLPDMATGDRGVRARQDTGKSRRRHAQLTPKSQVVRSVKVRRAMT